METQQSVWSEWEQIKEDQEDYQYFKEKDQEQLSKTLEAIRREQGLDKKMEV